MIVPPEVLKACLKGSEKGQYTLYKLLFPHFMRICVRYAKNREKAEELLNQGFMKVIQNLKSFEEGTDFKSWSKRVMVNFILDELRKEKRRNSMFWNTDYSESWLHQKESRNTVDEYMGELEMEQVMHSIPENCRLVFNLYAIEGYNHKEIAKIMGLSERHSKRLLVKARELLKEKLSKMEIYSDAG